jgi:peptidoglycan hydrolase-like amidase
MPLEALEFQTAIAKTYHVIMLQNLKKKKAVEIDDTVRYFL